MPLNEASGRPSRPNKKETAALREIYGIGEEPKYMPELTPEEVESMRALLQKHDQKLAGDWDPNRPVHNRYVFKEFPKMLYGQDGTVPQVENKEQEAAMLKDGFSLNPFSKKYDYSIIRGGKALTLQAAADLRKLEWTGREKTA
jgi:hypothetical protein